MFDNLIQYIEDYINKHILHYLKFDKYLHLNIDYYYKLKRFDNLIHYSHLWLFKWYNFFFDLFKFITLTYTTTNISANIWITTNASVLTWTWNTWIWNYCTILTCVSIGTSTSVCCRWNWITCSTVWAQIIRTWICEYLTSWSAKSIFNYYLNFKLNQFKNNKLNNYLDKYKYNHQKAYYYMFHHSHKG